MKNIRILVISLALIALAGTEASYALETASAVGPNGFTVVYRPEHLRADTLLTDGKSYLRWAADGHAERSRPGEPSIPVRVLFFAAPQGERPAIRAVVWSQRLFEGVTPPPVPTLFTDTVGFTRERFIEDPVRYAMSGFEPQEFAEIGGSFDTAGVRVWELLIHPVRCDTRAKTVSIGDSIEVTVTWNGNLGRIAPGYGLPDNLVNRGALAPEIRKIAASADASENPFAVGDWYKVACVDSGFHVIAASELAAAGFQVGMNRTSDIRMYYGGGRVLDTNPYEPTTAPFHEIAIRVKDTNNDGWLGQEDSIIFYCESLSRFLTSSDRDSVSFQNHPYSRTNVYWITTTGEGTALRIPELSAAPSEALPSRTSFREILHFERDNQLEYPESGIEWYWDKVTGTTSKYFSFSAPGSVSGDSVAVRAAFLNPPFSRGDTFKILLDQSLEMYVNDAGPFTANFPQIQRGFTEMRFSGSFSEKNNLFKIRRTTGQSDEYILLDWFEIEYERRLEFTDRILEYFIRGNGGPVKYTVANVQKSGIEAFDTTDPYRVTALSGAIWDAAGKTLTFQISPPAGRFSRITLFDPASYRKPMSITRKTRSDLRNPRTIADHVVITHRMFLDEAKRLADWRSRDSVIDPLKSVVVDVDDIYDEFGWGVYDPTAIRDFLAYARDRYSPGVRYCCLIGDTTYKYKNVSPSQKSRNLVPTFTWKDVATDDYFTWKDPTLSPSIAIGRLCANTVEEAKILVDKTIEYERNPEQGDWHNRALLIADDERNEWGRGQDREFSFAVEDIDQLNYIPKWIERKKLMLIEYPLKNSMKPDASEDLFKWFNEGTVIATYIGHGNKDLLAHEHILVGSRDIERFNGGGRLPLFLIMSCDVGKFDRLDFTSLSELLHLRKGGGCLAVISASRETYQGQNMTLLKAFYANLFNTKKNPEYRIGHALRYAKESSGIIDIIDNNDDRYNLFGDPATRLLVPRFRFAVSPVDSFRRLQKVAVAGNIVDSGKPVPYTGTLTINAQGPKLHKKYIINAGFEIDYTMPGNTFYRGEIPVSGASFATRLVVPKDLSTQADDSQILFFASGEGKEASWALTSLPSGGIDPSAPEDTAGPEIRLSFDGKVFESGDYVKRQPTASITLNDPSGINIYGNRGHNATLTLDRADISVITDELKFTGGPSTAVAVHSFPVLTPGEHTLEVSAYDSYNNVTKKEFVINVVGSETGDVSIENLLNYPNPMGTDGTTFTFSLTDDARAADIKVFSLSGRLVETVRFSAGYGFNQVRWKPSHDLANGVYFYKLTVRSLNGRRAVKIEKLAVMR